MTEKEGILMIYIFGHRNPDTDSICSAIALSRLKNRLGMETKACVLETINKEAEYILKRFSVERPEIIDDIKMEVKDLAYEDIPFVGPESSILQAFETMEKEKVKILPVCDENLTLLGIITMKDIAMGLIQNDERRLRTHMKNIVDDLDGKMLVGKMEEVDGQIIVMAFYHKTLEKNTMLDSGWISIVGDNYENIEFCIRSGVQLVVVTGSHEIPAGLLKLAERMGVPIMSVLPDTYMTSKKINQCTYVSSIMRKDEICALKEYEYLEDVYKRMGENRHSYYPIIDNNDRYIGFIGRNQLLNPKKKQVIMVDHNEYSQSAPGIEEAEILEVVDHHKIGDIRTNLPISFRNMPVGSTCTIIYRMYGEFGLKPEGDVAGLLLSGIISDTLNFKSPTTTPVDVDAAKKLNKVLKLDMDRYAQEMFKVGTSLEGLPMETIFYRDFKTFEIGNKTSGISQVITMDIDSIELRRQEMIGFIKKEHEANGYMTTLMVITDIIKEGSTILYETEVEGLIGKAFGIPEKQGMFVQGVISRKKQVVPKLMEALNRMGRY